MGSGERGWQKQNQSADAQTEQNHSSRRRGEAEMRVLRNERKALVYQTELQQSKVR